MSSFWEENKLYLGSNYMWGVSKCGAPLSYYYLNNCIKNSKFKALFLLVSTLRGNDSLPCPNTAIKGNHDIFN